MSEKETLTRRVLFENYEMVPLDLLVKAYWNYKEENPIMSSKLENNLRRNGQVENIIVRELDDGLLEVLNGNHRVDAMQKIGFEEVVVCNKGVLSDEEAHRIAIETNETRFPSDVMKMSRVALELTKEFVLPELLETLPFGQHNFDEFGILTKFDWESSLKQEEHELKTRRCVACPSCGKIIGEVE